MHKLGSRQATPTVAIGDRGRERNLTRKNKFFRTIEISYEHTKCISTAPELLFDTKVEAF